VGSVNSTLLAELAEAVTFGDGARLAAAIEAAEGHHLIPLAARMRIVLAQQTGDASQLEQARPVLERLGGTACALAAERPGTPHATCSTVEARAGRPAQPLQVVQSMLAQCKPCCAS
jgi:hypothetical protein